MFNKKFLGSNIALILGVLTIFAGLAYPSGTLFAGIYIVLGALAYKSLKARKIGLVQNSKLRPTLEVGAIIVVTLLILMQNDLQENMYNDPIPNVIIPLWIIIAYLLLYFRKDRVETT